MDYLLILKRDIYSFNIVQKYSICDQKAILFITILNNTVFDQQNSWNKAIKDTFAAHE